MRKKEIIEWSTDAINIGDYIVDVDCQCKIANELNEEQLQAVTNRDDTIQLDVMPPIKCIWRRLIITTIEISVRP